MKKIVSLLIILILLLCTSCFAFTLDDVKTLSYNWFVNAYNNNVNDAMQYVSNYDYSAINEYVNNNDYYLIAFCDTDYINSSGYLYIWVCKKKTQNPYMYQYQTTYNRVNNVDRYYVLSCGNNNNLPNYQTSDYHDINGDFVYLRDNTLKVIYSEIDIYNQQYSNIWWYGGNYTPSWLFDSVNFNLFKIDINTSSDTQFISIVTSDNDTISNIPVIYNNNFGVFLDDTWLVYQFYLLDFWYWNGSNWVYKLLYLKSSNNGFARLSNNDYMSFIYSDSNTYEEYQLILKDLYSFNNVVFHFQVVNGINDSADGYFLLGDGNTIISNGSLDTSILGNDYYKQFENLDLMINDNNNTQSVIDNTNENNNFWKNTYDNLFAMDSGDVNDIFTTIQPYISSGDSPIGFYNIMFDSLSDDPTDFVISWNSIPVRLTLFNGQEVFSGDLISANRINFSEACRENEVLSTILNWVRIFNVLFFITSYLYTIYTCILVILGISLTFVDPPEPEHRQIGFINDWRDK